MKLVLTMADVASLCGFEGRWRCERARRLLNRFKVPVTQEKEHGHWQALTLAILVHAPELYEALERAASQPSEE